MKQNTFLHDHSFSTNIHAAASSIQFELHPWPVHTYFHSMLQLFLSWLLCLEISHHNLGWFALRQPPVSRGKIKVLFVYTNSSMRSYPNSIVFSLILH